MFMVKSTGHGGEEGGDPARVRRGSRLKEEE